MDAPSVAARGRARRTGGAPQGHYTPVCRTAATPRRPRAPSARLGSGEARSGPEGEGGRASASGGEAGVELVAEGGEGGEVDGLFGEEWEVEQKLLGREEAAERVDAGGIAGGEPGEEGAAVGGVRLGRSACGVRSTRRRMDAVDDDRPQPVTGLAELAPEEERVGVALLAR